MHWDVLFITVKLFLGRGSCCPLSVTGLLPFAEGGPYSLKGDIIFSSVPPGFLNLRSVQQSLSPFSDI